MVLSWINFELFVLLVQMRKVFNWFPSQVWICLSKVTAEDSQKSLDSTTLYTDFNGAVQTHSPPAVVTTAPLSQNRTDHEDVHWQVQIRKSLLRCNSGDVLSVENCFLPGTPSTLTQSFTQSICNLFFLYSLLSYFTLRNQNWIMTHMWTLFDVQIWSRSHHSVWWRRFRWLWKPSSTLSQLSRK